MLRAISLYTGVGGLDFGFEAAGIETSVAVEFDGAACRAIRANRRWPLLEGDIHKISSQSIMEAAQLGRGEADVLIGGPPCQPFSKSSYWAAGDSRRLDDPRSGTLQEYLRVLRDTLPKAFLLENVHGLAFKDKDEGLQYLLRGIASINKSQGTKYSVSWKVMNAADYGVPQLRERVFLIGHRDGKQFEFPAPTHSDDGAAGTKAHVTAWEAIGDLDDSQPDIAGATPGGKWADLLPSIPEGKNYLWHTNRGGGLPLFGWRTRYWSFLLKLAKDRPSWTIQAQPGSAIGPFHWKNRRLTSKELARIQTFPDDIKFDCGRSDMQKLVGNAVPSLLAEHLARAIRTQFLDSKVFRAQPKLKVAMEGAPPKAERVKSVPAKYRDLIGEHADHPGEGQGGRARAQAGAAA